MKKSLRLAILTALMIPAISFASNDLDLLTTNDSYVGHFNLGCNEALECITKLDKERTKISAEVNFLFDSLRFVSASYDKDKNTVSHKYYLIRVLDGLDGEEVNGLMFDADDSLVALYCTDPVIRSAMENNGTIFKYSIDVSKDGLVSDSGYTGEPFVADTCKGIDELSDTFYEDVVKVSGLITKKTTDYVTDNKLQIDDNQSFDKNMNKIELEGDI